MNEQVLNEQMMNDQRSVLLELIQEDTGRLVLRESKNKTEILLSIDFSDKLKNMLGGDVHFVGEHMLEAAMTAVMHQQLSQWHANVFDEEPKFYS